MRTTIATLRTVIVAGLVASLGFAGTYPCAATGVLEKLPCQTSSDSHTCVRVSKTGHCCCGAGCHCGEQAPQQDNKPAIPSRSSDRIQPLALVSSTAAFVGTTIAAWQIESCPAYLTGGSQSLVAQGTRLNC